MNVRKQVLKPFNCMETIATVQYKQISSNSFKNEITDKLFTYKSYMYIYLNVRKQMTHIRLLLLHSNIWNHFTACKQTINNK